MDNSKIIKLILAAIAIYFLLHIAFALAGTPDNSTIVVTTPDGRIGTCTILYGTVTCF